MSLQLVFNDTIKTLFSSSVPQKLAIALSGGVDSFALAHLLKKFVKEERLDTQIYPITINHNLRAKSAAEIPVIERELSKFDLHGNFLTSNLQFPEEYKTKPFEELARLKRYQAINDLCQSKGISNLLMGHHFDDQIETFTLRLLSNSGVIGLSGIQPIAKSSHHSHPERLNVIRPLLNVKKDQLIKYCQDNNIQWLEDQTNLEDITKRNIVRNYFVQNPKVKQDLIENYQKVQHFNSLIEGKVNILYGGLNKAGKIDLSNLSNGTIKVALSDKQIANHTDLVLSRLFFKLLYPISPSPNYHYSFNKVQDNIARLRTPGDATFSLLQLQWDVKSLKEDGSGLKEITVSRQNVGADPVVEKVTVPANGESEWVLFDNIYWFKLRNPTSTERYYTIRNLLKDDKVNFKDGVALPEDFKYSQYKNSPVLVDEEGKIEGLITNMKDQNVEWRVKENIFKF